MSTDETNSQNNQPVVCGETTCDVGQMCVDGACIADPSANSNEGNTSNTGLDCTANANCANGLVCTDEVCVEAPPANNTEAPPENAQVACNANSNCSNGQVCTDNVCAEAPPANNTEAAPSNACNANANCANGQVCTGDVCVDAPPVNNTAQSSPTNANTAANGCGGANACGGDEICYHGECRDPLERMLYIRGHTPCKGEDGTTLIQKIPLQNVDKKYCTETLRGETLIGDQCIVHTCSVPFVECRPYMYLQNPNGSEADKDLRTSVFESAIQNDLVATGMQKENCEAVGGTFDNETNICSLPEACMLKNTQTGGESGDTVAGIGIGAGIVGGVFLIGLLIYLVKRKPAQRERLPPRQTGFTLVPSFQ